MEGGNWNDVFFFYYLFIFFNSCVLLIKFSFRPWTKLTTHSLTTHCYGLTDPCANLKCLLFTVLSEQPKGDDISQFTGTNFLFRFSKMCFCPVT